MTKEKEMLVSKYRKYITDTQDDKHYNTFLNSLELIELELFLFVEAKKANTFLEELSASMGNKISIEDLLVEEKRKSLIAITNNPEKILGLIDFWKNFGQTDYFDKNIVKAIIEKHNRLYKELTKTEIDFFMNCNKD